MSRSTDAAATPEAEALVVAPGARLAFETGDGLSAEVALDGGPARPISADGMLAPLDGDHWLVTISRNAAGVPSTPRWLWLRVDSVAPSVELSVTPTPWSAPDGRRWVRPGAEVRAQATDALAGVAKVSLMAGAAEQAAAEDTVTLALPPTGGGVQAAAQAVDRVGNTSAAATLDLEVDAWPPTGEVRIDGAWVEVSGRTVLGPQARLVLDDDDQGAGIAERQLTANGSATTQQVWGAPWRSGRHEAGVSLRDHVGNATTVTPLRFEVDAAGPEISWQVVSAGARSAAGLAYYPSSVTVEASASDALAGLASLAYAASAGDAPTPDAPTPISGPIQIAGSKVELIAVDRVGNESRLMASWQIDDDAPRIQVLGPRGKPLVPDTERKRHLRVGARLTLSAVDEGVGLAEATYVLNRLTIPGFGPPAPVPSHLDLPIKGQYMLTIEARDLLGHHTRSQWLLIVGRGGN